MGGNEYGKSGHLSYLHSFEELNDDFKVHLFRASVLHLMTDTDNMYSHAATADFFKWKHC